MHPALHIQEVFLEILSYHQMSSSDLFALARTCHAFKEPALNALWKILLDPSPIARCLPGAYSESRRWCSFDRSLTQAEWHILREYTRRIRFLRDQGNLDWKSVMTYLNPPPTEPLFPNLRSLKCDYCCYLLSMPFPSLVNLTIDEVDEELSALRDSFESISKYSPNIRRLSIRSIFPDGIVSCHDIGLGSCTRQWRGLKSLCCEGIVFDIATLSQLSRMPALTQIACTLDSRLLQQDTPFDSPPFPPNLRRLTLRSQSCDQISYLLSQSSLPVITHFAAFVDDCPTKQELSSCLTSLRASFIGQTIRKLQFGQRDGKPWRALHSESLHDLFGLEDLQPCMAFHNLHRFKLDMIVNLTSSELLFLVSAWPHLKELFLCWGRGTHRGITPDGLLQLLKTCQELNKISISIDTQGYTECRESPAGAVGLTFKLPPILSLDVVDSSLEEESVPAITAFLSSIARWSKLSFYAYVRFGLDRQQYVTRWIDACRQATRNH